jgi:hypothetical protein
MLVVPAVEFGAAVVAAAAVVAPAAVPLVAFCSPAAGPVWIYANWTLAVAL